MNSSNPDIRLLACLPLIINTIPGASYKEKKQIIEPCVVYYLMSENAGTLMKCGSVAWLDVWRLAECPVLLLPSALARGSE